jgi:hypothetical protein
VLRMSAKLPPIRASPVRARTTSPQLTSATTNDSVAGITEERRLTKERRQRRDEDRRQHDLHAQRENGFRYNAFQTNGVFSCFSADTLVLADRDRKEVEIAVARRRAQLDHDRRARELARTDELRRRRMEQRRIQKEHDAKKAREEAELRKLQEDAALAKRSKAAAVSMSERRRNEIESARELSQVRESHRETRRAGKDPNAVEHGGSNSPSSTPSPTRLHPQSRTSSQHQFSPHTVSALRVVWDSRNVSPTSEGSLTVEEGDAIGLMASLLGA